MIYILNIIVIFIVAFLIGSVIYLRTGLFKFFYHDILDWHQPDNSPQWYDSCSNHATCKYCNKEIMQDSQGNWF